MNLISSREVLELAFSSVEQIKDWIIKPSKIEAAQEKYIRPVFGKMYTTMLEGRYPEFVQEYLKPALAYFVRRDVIPELSMPTGNTGVHLYGGQHSSAATDKQRDLAMTSAMDSASALLGKAIRYIEANRNMFPEYEPEQNITKRTSIRGKIIL